MTQRIDNLKLWMEKNPDDPFPLYAIAMEYKTAESWEQSLETFTRVREKFPQYVPTYLMAGQVAEQLEQWEEAIHWYELGMSTAKKQNDTHAHQELLSALTALHTAQSFPT